jgi:hypothetical protein
MIQWILISDQGDQMSLRRNRPKCSPTHFFVKSDAYVTCAVENSGAIICATFEIFKRQPKVNNNLIGENWRNLGPML